MDCSTADTAAFLVAYYIAAGAIVVGAGFIVAALVTNGSAIFATPWMIVAAIVAFGVAAAAFAVAAGIGSCFHRVPSNLGPCAFYSAIIESLNLSLALYIAAIATLLGIGLWGSLTPGALLTLKQLLFVLLGTIDALLLVYLGVAIGWFACLRRQSDDIPMPGPSQTGSALSGTVAMLIISTVSVFVVCLVFRAEKARERLAPDSKR